MSKKHEIIYPVFLECCQYADDVFWQGIFEELAYGIPPYGTYINKGFLTCSYKGKEFSYKIERKNPEILYTDITKLLTEKLGILSQKEKVTKRLAFERLEKNIKDSRHDWASIRKKNIKDTLLEKYVIEMKRKHSLSIKQCKYLLSIIIISIMFKTITSKDIEYDEDRITNINGIEFVKSRVVLKRNLCSLEPLTEPLEVSEEPETRKKMSDSWEKHLKQVRSKA